jgi:hypothetical protein
VVIADEGYLMRLDLVCIGLLLAGIVMPSHAEDHSFHTGPTLDLGYS